MMTGVARLDAEAHKVTRTPKHPRLRLPGCDDLRSGTWLARCHRPWPLM
jgi:hypothetical protein